ncbi:RlpA-like double-psi beta-barrel-protein domain-containing protein-containing protein [Xylariaceae sp. FL1019]|nr:RlpA-like double-psi beta-barrel-protein domain-containing protein-containing protein [Xylariaceae sp. FL1019]
MVCLPKIFLAIATASVAVSAIPLSIDDIDGIEFLDDDIDTLLDGNATEIASTIEARAAVHHGDLTYYTPGLGACGVTNGENDPIVAISHVIFDPKTPGDNPNNNPLCGKKIKIRRNGKSVVVTVRDRCEGCEKWDLDVPVKVFKKLARPAAGRVKMNWNYR